MTLRVQVAQPAIGQTSRTLPEKGSMYTTAQPSGTPLTLLGTNLSLAYWVVMLPPPAKVASLGHLRHNVPLCADSNKSPGSRRYVSSPDLGWLAELHRWWPVVTFVGCRAAGEPCSGFTRTFIECLVAPSSGDRQARTSCVLSPAIA